MFTRKRIVRKIFNASLHSLLFLIFFVIYNELVIHEGDISKIDFTLPLIKSYILLFGLLFSVIIIFQSVGIHFIYKYRYLVALILFIICIFMEITGSSIGYFTKFFGDKETNVIFGTSRSIRSDEWAVLTPMTWSQFFDPQGPFSYFSSVIRAEKTDVFLEYGLPVKSWLIIFKPFLIGYLFLPIAKGMSFFWCGRLIALFLISLEFGRLISEDDRKLALVYSILITLSPFVQWWFAINGLVEMLIFSQLSIVLLHKYISCEGKKHYIYPVLISLCAGGFILTMYPAWMIPLTYIILGCIFWIIGQKSAKELYHSIPIKDAVIWGICLMVLCLTGIYVYTKSSDTILQIASTVYPGKRLSSGGGPYEYIFHYVANLWFPILNQSPYSNLCESAHFIHLFPVGHLIYLKYYFTQKKHDTLSLIMFGISIFLFIYSVFGVPDFIASITFMNRTTSQRAIPIFEFVSVILLIRVLSLLKDTHNESSVLYFIASVILSITGVLITRNFNPKYYSHFMLGVEIVIFSILFYGCLVFHGTVKTIWTVTIFFVSFSSSFLVNPVRLGIDDILKIKELSVVREIIKNDPNAIWIVEGCEFPITNFLLLQGGRTINSTNVYPDMARWKQIDTDSLFEEVFNRYAHITIRYDDTNEMKNKFELLYRDQFLVSLNYEDLKKLDIKYIFSNHDLSADYRFQYSGGTQLFKIFQVTVNTQ